MNLIEALEQYVQCLAMEPMSIVEGRSQLAHTQKAAPVKRKAA